VNGGKDWELKVAGRIWIGGDAPDDAADRSSKESFWGKIGSFFERDVVGENLQVELLTRQGQPVEQSIKIQSIYLGEFTGSLTLSDADVQKLRQECAWADGEIPYRLAGSKGDPDSSGQIYLINGSGISVISDIDDTVRDTGIYYTSSKNPLKRLITLERALGPFIPVNGMADLYSYWLKNGRVRFHYVSGGPDWWEKATEKGLDNAGFPSGSIDLRKVSLSCKKSVQAWSGGNPCRYKIEEITKIITDFPGRQFCLIGDAGEGDKRALLHLAAMYPDQVKWVFIRHLSQLPDGREDFVPIARYQVKGNQPESDCSKSNPKTPDTPDTDCPNPNPSIPPSVTYKEFYQPDELRELLPIPH
jgi:phosphatidate phosphatase APP1